MTTIVMSQPVMAAPAPMIIQTQAPSGGIGDNVAIGKAELGNKPALTTCSNCRQRVETKVLYKVGCYSWCMCIVLMCLGLMFGCCLIPFFAKKCKDAHHSCPQCNAQLCVHKRCSCC